MSALIDCPHCATRVLPTSGRICPACLKNVDFSPDRKPQTNPPETSVSGVTPEPKRERAAPPIISQPDPSRSVEETIIPASPGNALQRPAPRYKNLRRSPLASQGARGIGIRDGAAVLARHGGSVLDRADG